MKKHDDIIMKPNSAIEKKSTTNTKSDINSISSEANSKWNSNYIGFLQKNDQIIGIYAIILYIIYLLFLLFVVLLFILLLLHAITIVLLLLLYYRFEY
jgi:hypothetical protein